MTWNYRVIEFTDHAKTLWRSIHEVYYDNDRPTSYTEQPATIVSDADSDAPMTNDELRDVLNLMLKCLDKPVLVEQDFMQTEAGKEEA